MNSHKTAMTRQNISRPLRHLIGLGLIGTKDRILDFGCGKGYDYKNLARQKFKAVGYDPYYFPKLPKGKFSLVIMTYVINVLHVPERNRAILRAWDYVKKGGRLAITARTEREVDNAADEGGWKSVAWGYETSKGTYQRGYTYKQLDTLVSRILPGVKNIQWGGVNSGGAMVIALKG